MRSSHVVPFDPGRLQLRYDYKGSHGQSEVNLETPVLHRIDRPLILRGLCSVETFHPKGNAWIRLGGLTS